MATAPLSNGGDIRLRARPARRIAGNLQGSFEKWLRIAPRHHGRLTRIPGPGAGGRAGLPNNAVSACSGRFALIC